jgi:SAM-dependent methyltransferase
MFLWLNWHIAKRRLAALPATWPAHVVKYERHRRRVEDFPPDARVYSRLAEMWNAFAAGSPHYAPFLMVAGKRYGRPIRRVLDLACGTGLLARRLAQRVEAVVGLDASADMLCEARSRNKDGNIRYVCGDFRAFHLGESFDAIVCGGDSLNYVASPEELPAVFHCVRRHLSPGGLFAFDTVDHKACLALGGMKLIAEVNGERFAVYHFYDPEKRASEDRAVFYDAIEPHKRIPIEYDDVRSAAADADLEILDYFSTPRWPGLFSSYYYVRYFYVLRNRG